jgi:hypothetical protein
MNILKKISFTSLPSVIALWAMALGCYSCTTTDEPTEQTDDEYYSMSILLNTGELPQSRSLTTTYVDGTGYENYINPNDVHVYIYPDLGDDSASGWAGNIDNYSGELTITGISQVSDNVTALECRTKYLPTDSPTHAGFRVCVIANWHTRRETSLDFKDSNLGYLCWYGTGRFTYLQDTDANNNPAFVLGEGKGMPMYGIKQVPRDTAETFKRGGLAASTTINVNMLRSMAKVVVKSSSGASLSDVKLKLAPYACSAAPMYMYSNTSRPTQDNVHMPGDGSSAEYLGSESGTLPTVENVAFEKVVVAGTDDDGNAIADDPKQSYYQLYVPETRLVAFTSKQGKSMRTFSTEVNIKFRGSDETLYFKNYDTEEPFDIMRNTIYIYDVKTASRIDFYVFDWTTKESNPIVFDEPPIRKSETEQTGTTETTTSGNSE